MGIIGNKNYVEVVEPYIEKYGIRLICEVDDLPEVQEILDERLTPLPSNLDFFGFEIEGQEEESKPTITPEDLHVIFERAYLRKMVSEMTRSTAQSVVTFFGRTNGFMSTRSGASFGDSDIIRAYAELHPDEDELKRYEEHCLWL